MLSAVLVAIVGVVCGGIVGVVFGFSATSHPDVLRGVRPDTNSRIIRFLARPTAEMSPAEGLLFILLMLAWLGVFFGLMLLPGVAAGRLTEDTVPLVPVAYVFTAVAGWLGFKFGAHAWRTMS